MRQPTGLDFKIALYDELREDDLENPTDKIPLRISGIINRALKRAVDRAQREQGNEAA